METAAPPRLSVWTGRLQDALTVKLLLTFFVLDSATLASDRSTSSKIRDCRGEETGGGKKREQQN
ncbi:hypothetical protein EYF80_064286 [Liparis tanakae]|uniref:Uncharacterized protein n=1 Tax=Liparis tanakae TaxID=230148 RepID=A0A4Z2EAL8_9TELE|nr:hypothetical protein EYF80_064286 [Liparis tanakae]